MNKISQIVWFVALGMLACYGLTLSWILLAAAVVCVVVAGLTSWVCGAIDGGVKWRWLDGVVLASLAYFGLRQIGSPVWDLAKEDFLLMALGVVVYGAFRVRPMGGMVVALLTCFVVWNGGAYLWQSQGGDPWVPMDVVCTVAQETKNFGLFQDYGAFGNAMAMSGVVILSAVLWGASMSMWRRVFLLIIAVFAIVLALISGSRSAVLSVAVAALVMCVVGWIYAAHLERGMRAKVHGLIILLGLAGTVTIGVLGYQTFQERVANRSEWDEATGNVRTAYWGMAVEQVLEKPLVGTGARSYSYECFRHWDKTMHFREGNPEFVHNEYLQLWADYGLLGLLFVCGLLLWHWILGFQGVFVSGGHGESGAWMRVAGLLVVTVACVHSFTDFPLRLPWNLCLLAIGLAWCARSEGKPDSSILPEAVSRGMIYPVMILATLGVGAYAGKEVWAGLPLVEVQQVREDPMWKLEPSGVVLRAHEEAALRSPDFRRSLHLGKLYEKLAGGNAEMLQLAESSYRDALDRHPYLVDAYANLGSLLYRTGKYQEAEVVFSKGEPYGSARDWWLNYYLNWAANETMRAQQAMKERDYSLADERYQHAIELLLRGDSTARPRLDLMCHSYLMRMYLLLLQGRYGDSEELWEEFVKNVPLYIARTGSPKFLQVVADGYYAAARKEWRERRPMTAKHLFERARDLYSIEGAASKNAQSAERHLKQLAITQVLEILETAGF